MDGPRGLESPRCRTQKVLTHSRFGRAGRSPRTQEILIDFEIFLRDLDRNVQDSDGIFMNFAGFCLSNYWLHHVTPVSHLSRLRRYLELRMSSD